jgi:hypothetical protein
VDINATAFWMMVSPVKCNDDLFLEKCIQHLLFIQHLYACCAHVVAFHATIYKNVSEIFSLFCFLILAYE